MNNNPRNLAECYDQFLHARQLWKMVLALDSAQCLRLSERFIITVISVFISICLFSSS